MVDKAKAKKIAELNDHFRNNPSGNGTIVVTQGIQMKGRDFVDKAVVAFMTYSDFTKDNDPWKERDFGAFEIDGERCFWKIDYYAKDSLDYGSEDPSDPSKTHRIATIMKASEY